MVYAGEDPRFIFRRLIIFAGEDVGLADPRALEQVMAAAQAFDYVGMPEGRYHLAQAVLYLSTAPKSNSTMAFFDALAVVQQEREAEVPNHLRDGSRDREGFGHGEGYLYPHAYRDHWVAQQYLPEALQGKTFYQPGALGFELAIRDEVARRREAQLAAMLDNEFSAPDEVLTNSPADRDRDRWLQRTVSEAGQRLGELRDRMIELAHLPRHGVALDLTAGSGLLTWEAVRQVPEGQVWSVARTADEAAALTQQAQNLPPLDRPVILQGEPLSAAELVGERDAEQRFDALMGRSLLSSLEPERAALELAHWRELLQPGGRLVLAEPFAAQSQRVYRLVEGAGLADELLARWAEAEESIYRDADAVRFRWNPELFTQLLTESGYLDVSVQEQVFTTQQRIGEAQLDSWFPQADAASSYAAKLGALLTPEEVSEVEGLLRRRLAGRTVPWRMTLLLVRAIRAEGEEELS
jgi:putative ATPase